MVIEINFSLYSYQNNTPHDICWLRYRTYASEGFFYSLRHIYVQIQDFIIENIVSLQVNSIPDLLQSSSVIGSAIQETEEMSPKSLVSK